MIRRHPRTTRPDQLFPYTTPDVQTLRHVEMQEPMYVYARDGRLLALFGETRRYPIDIDEVPKRLKQAFLATEDARFYEHHGVDYTGVARALWLIIKTGSKEGVRSEEHTSELQSLTRIS